MAVEDVIAQQSVTMADQMVRIAQWAHSEEDVRYECNKLIDEFLRKAGIRVRGRHEYHIGSGRLDSKYQGVLLEYKYPKGPDKIVEGKDAPGNRAVVGQLKKRFADFEREERFRPERLFGVGCDADTLLFVRYQGGKWVIDEPQPVTPHSVERLLRALVSLGAQGKSFTPEYLSADFGSDSEIAQKGVRDLCKVIRDTKSKKAVTFFNQWKVLFGEVCGYDVEGKNPRIEKLGEHYGIPDAGPAELLFAVHSYYAIFMKFLAAEIAGSFSPLGVSVLKKCVGAPTSAALRREMERLEQGGIWSQLGITNFLEGDLFSWYLDAWDGSVSEAVRAVVLRLDEYDPATLSVDPSESRDLLKKLYQQLFPKSVRHDLGEYYTPDWLAEHVLNQLGYDGDPDKRLLDPACGSGTFLVMAINRIKTWFEEHRHECGFGEAELVGKILHNIIGFDLNPLAVMAARTNYLMTLRDLLKHAASVEIPIYLCDSVMTPAEYGDLFTGSLKTARKLKTSAAEFLIPNEVTASREHIGQYAETLEFCVRNRYSASDFLARCTEEGLPTRETKLHLSLYETLRRLDVENQNGIWARIIKNAFAPLFIERVDYVAGNPPWVAWNNLPSQYREDTRSLWAVYGFFTQKGYRALLPAGPLDISALFTYAVVDNFVRPGARLGFVLTQTLFKSMGAGEGFRRLRLPDGTPLKVLHVDDMSSMRPFEAENRTAVFITERGRQTEFPVPYFVWRQTKGDRIRGEESYSRVLRVVERKKFAAMPVQPDNTLSPWSTVPWNDGGPMDLSKMAGESGYTPRSGIHTHGANAVFWVEPIGSTSDPTMLVRNYTRGAKNQVSEVEHAIESKVIYPLVRGRDIARWSCDPSLRVIVPHDPNAPKKSYSETEFRRKYPRAFSYLAKFRKLLAGRSMMASLGQGEAFFKLFKIGPYTFAPHKVAWREQASDFTACVLSPDKSKPLIADHKATIVALDDAVAAHYLCAALNSAPCRYFVQAYSIQTSNSTHILKNLRVPRFDPSSELHRRLANLSQRCHAAAGKTGARTVAKLEGEIDSRAAQLWGIAAAELKAMQHSLGEGDTKPRRRSRTEVADEESME